VYQDFEMALAGKELCDALEKEVGAGEAVLSVWPFHLLHEPELHLAAVRAAEQADVVIVAHRDTLLLPNPVKTWLSAWTARRLPASGGLVVFLPCSTAAAARSSHVALELLEAAGRAGMDFFCGTPGCVVAELVRRHAAPSETQSDFTGPAGPPGSDQDQVRPWTLPHGLRFPGGLGRNRPSARW
jgi:hypothetical protein